jgi:acetyl-CoA carboxylase biotin carboxyl carrier protein
VGEEKVQQAVNEAKDLIKMLESTSVRRMRLVAGDFQITIERAFAEATPVSAAPLAAAASAPSGRADDGRHRVLSPMVGTFYHSASPGASAFVEVGSRVERGQTIGIVEAMKVMNEVESDASGVVVEILVSNGQAVEFEQPLIAINTKG